MGPLQLWILSLARTPNAARRRHHLSSALQHNFQRSPPLQAQTSCAPALSTCLPEKRGTAHERRLLRLPAPSPLHSPAYLLFFASPEQEGRLLGADPPTPPVLPSVFFLTLRGAHRSIIPHSGPAPTLPYLHSVAGHRHVTLVTTNSRFSITTVASYSNPRIFNVGSGSQEAHFPENTGTDLVCM